MKPLRHFPVTTSTAGGTTTYTARCGFTSTDHKQFVDPRNYKVEQVTCVGCKTKKGRKMMNADFNIRETLDEYDKQFGESIMVNLARAELARLQHIEAAAREALERCHKLLIAIYAESDKLHNAPQDEKARAMAFMKINLSEYIIHIWPNRKAFENDLASLAAALKESESE